MDRQLAILGGPRCIVDDPDDLFTWPIVTSDHETAVLDVLRRGAMSQLDVTMEFEKRYAADMGMEYALACNTGTAAIECALYGMGVGVGDEVIAPSLTYWASILQVYSLGATPVFAEVNPESLCIDPHDIEHRITDRTKAIVVVHYAGVPADMDAILAISRRRGVAVLEDASHAHAATYNGKECGTIGDVSGFSIMSGKSFATGEGGILFTNNRRIYERALLFGHYSRHDVIENPELTPFVGLPAGGHKYRMHQLTSAFALTQLRYYRTQFAEIDRAMTYFCDALDSIDGLKAHRPPKGSPNTKGGWYFPLAHYDPAAFGGLSVGTFARAMQAEGVPVGAGCNKPLHTHPLFTSADIYGHGKPTRVAHSNRGIDAYVETLPVTEAVNGRIINLPWFKHHRPAKIDRYIDAFRKVAASADDLLSIDQPDADLGGYSSSFRR